MQQDDWTDISFWESSISLPLLHRTCLCIQLYMVKCLTQRSNQNYTDELKHSDHFPNMLLVLHVLLKQHQPAQTWTLQNPWRCPVVSGTKTLAKDPINFKVELLGLKLDSLAHPTNAQSDWDLEDVETRTTPHRVPQCSVEGHNILLKEATAIRNYLCQEGVYQVCNDV